MRRLRLAVIVTHPIQYHACQWRALSQENDLDVDVFFCYSDGRSVTFSTDFNRAVQWDRPLLQGYRSHVSRNFGSARSAGFLRVINPGIWWQLMTGGYDAVFLHSTNHATHLGAMVLARLAGKQVLVHSITYDLGTRPAIRARLRSLIYRLIYRLPTRCLVLGTHNLSHFQRSGVPQNRLVFTPHPVDNDFFRAEKTRLMNDTASAMGRFGVAPGTRVLLFCGKLIPKKQPQMLLEAFIEADLGRDWTLLIVGDGPLRGALEAQAASHPSVQVSFGGFLNQSEISQAYSLADVHALPSKQETWGLVVNESLNFGCAQIVSDMVGCAPDLVEGRTGEVFAHGDKAALIAILRSLVTDQEKWDRYRAAAEYTIDAWGVPAFVQGVKRALGLVAASEETTPAGKAQAA